MKRLIPSMVAVWVLACAAYGQGNQQRRAVQQPGVPMAGLPGVPGYQQEEVDLPKFDLEFGGGRPDELVEAIRAQVPGGILNAIIPAEDATTMLPPMKLKAVNVKQLFEALEFAMQKQVQFQTGFGPNGQAMLNTMTTVTTFRTTGPVTPESVWYFYVTKPQTVESQKTVRYYQLAPYLTQYKIDDITTAIQAGWKMLGEQGGVVGLNFHQDTKLLIAVGPREQVNMIESVLAELNKGLSFEPREKNRAIPTPEPNSSK